MPSTSFMSVTVRATSWSREAAEWPPAWHREVQNSNVLNGRWPGNRLSLPHKSRLIGDDELSLPR